MCYPGLDARLGVEGRRNAIKDKINQLKKFALVCLLMCYRLDFLLSVEAL